MVVSECSCLRFLYPFRFGASFDALVEGLKQDRLESREDPTEPTKTRKSHPVWEPVSFPRVDLLPHVAEYVNGEPNTGRAVWFQVTDQIRESLRGLGFTSNSKWQLTKGGKSVQFQVTSVEICLFRLGVGLLIFEVRREGPETATESFPDWQELLYHLRFLEDSRGAKLTASRKIGKDKWEDLRPGIVSDHDKDIHLGVFQQELMKRVLPKQSRWWSDVFVPGRAISFSVLFIDGAQEKEMMETLYRVRRAFPADREIRPSDEDLDPANRDLLSYARDQWFCFSMDSTAFVAFDAPDNDFFRQALPQHLRRDYFLPFLLALHQRFVLAGLSSDVASHWLPSAQSASDEKRERVFEKIQLDLLDLTARGYFRQVMHLNNHHRVYRRWQEVFLVQEVYEEVRDEVHEMHDYLMARRSERVAQIAAEQKAQTEASERARREREAARKAEAEASERARREREAARKAEAEANEKAQRERDAAQKAQAEATEKAQRERDAAQKARAEKHERLQTKRSQGLESLITGIGFILGIPALWLSFLGVNLKGWTTEKEGLTFMQGTGYFFGSLVVGAILFLGIRFLVLRWARSAEDSCVETDTELAGNSTVTTPLS